VWHTPCSQLDLFCNLFFFLHQICMDSYGVLSKTGNNQGKKEKGAGFIYTKEGSFFFLWAFFLFLCSIMFSTCSQLCSSSSQCVPLIAPLFIPYSLPKSSHFLTCNWVKGEALPSSHKNCYLGDLLRFQFFLGDVLIIMAHWKINK